MKHPWQVWLLFAACVLGVLAGMAWLTQQAIHTDEQRRAAEAGAELEQRVSLALWQMDTELAPIIAEEVVRPAASFRSMPGAVKPPPYVLIQFEVRDNDHWRSPQVPLQRSFTPQLDDLSSHVNYSALLTQLPDTPLPSAQEAGQNRVAMANAESNAPPPDGLQYANAPGASPFATEYFQNLQMPTKQLAQSPSANEAADFQQRGRRIQNAAEQNLINSGQTQVDNSEPQQQTGANFGKSRPEQVGVSKPVWIGDRLILARRVTSGGHTFVQGSWLDWPKLKARLLGEAADSLPDADLVPVTGDASAAPSRMLAGLPVRLVVKEPVEATTISPTLRWALTMGWGAVLLAIAVSALLLQGVMTLSERRAAFVSSVTHELRTPLTTFRMYAEMLAKGMVPDAARRQEYYHTLQRESERLTLLVENVLAYARLERGRKPQAQDRVTLESLLDRVGPRLKQRAAQAGMECVIELQDNKAPSPCPLPTGEGAAFTTDQAVVEQILFNLVDNASKYAREATDRRIHVEANRNGEFVTLTVRDHGPGMNNGFLSRPMQPFGKSAQQSAESAPGVGLGLALCRRLAKQLGGRLEIDTTADGGASVSLLLQAT